MNTYVTQYGMDIDFGRTIRGVPPPAGTEVRPSLHIGKYSPIIFSGGENGRHLHRCMEQNIKGVRYRVYSSFGGDTSFRELYEKSLADRLLRIHRQRCAEGAAGG